MKKILLIEDNEDVRESTAEILELSKYSVTTAENGKVGLEKALAVKPDLIICDILMPVLDGYGVLHAVHRNEEIRNTPFIFLTAKAERTDFRKGMEMGADDYITKPFTGTELLKAVESRINKIERLKEEFTPGVNGLMELLEVNSVNRVLQEFTEGRIVDVYKKKQVVYSEGNHPVRLYYVVKGKIKSFKTNSSGRELVTNLYGPGDFMGHVALLEGSVYKDTTVAMVTSELAVIPREELDKILNSNPEVARKFIQLLSKNISEIENQLLNLAYNSLRKKVTAALLAVERKYQSNGQANCVIDISRENLATIAGTATESLIRTLSDFSSQKLIEIRNGCIHILDREKLERIIQ